MKLTIQQLNKLIRQTVTESLRPQTRPLTVNGLRRMVMETIQEVIDEQDPNAVGYAPAAPAPAAMPVAPAAPPGIPAAPPPPGAPVDPNAAARAPAPAPIAEALRRIVRETVRKHLMEKEEKWMQKAGKKMEKKGTKGALHRQLGKPEGEKLSKSELESLKRELQKKAEGDKKLSASDRKLLRRVMFALNAMKAKD